MANLFNEIPGLVGCWNATGDVQINPENSKVAGWGPSEAGDGYGGLDLVTQRGDTFTFEAAAVGAMPAVVAEVSKQERLQATFTPGFDITSQGYTMAVLYKLTEVQTNTNTRYIWSMRATDTVKSAYHALGPNNSYFRVWDNNDQSGYLGPNTADIARYMTVTTAPTDNSAEYYEDGVVVPGGPRDGKPESGGVIDVLTVLNAFSGSSSAAAAVALVVLYDRELDTGELTELHDLIAHWRDNAAPPTTYTPPVFSEHPLTPISASVGGSITISATATGDPQPTYQWVVGETPATEYFSGTVTEDVVGNTSTLTVTNLQFDESASIRLKAENLGGVTYSLASELTIQVSYPTSETFGPVRANDPTATYQWQIKPPGEDWTSTLAAGMVPRVDGEDQYLDVNSATVDQSGTQVKLTADTPYSDGIESNVQTLNVVPAS